MKFKTLVLMFLALAFQRMGLAQTDSLLQSISLAEARELALKNNPGQLSKALTVEMAAKKTESEQWKRIPDIYGNVDLQRNLIVPVTPVPSEAFNPNAQPGALTPIKFSTNYTSNIGLNAKWDLFNPQNHGQLKVARQQQEMTQTDLKIAANNLNFDVGVDYAACIIAQKQLDLAVADTTSKSKLLQLAQEKYDAGRINITELNQLRSDRNNTLSNFLNADKILKTARAQLLVDLGYNPEMNYQFTLTDSLDSILPKSAVSDIQNSQSLSVQKTEQQRALTEIQLGNTREGFLPTVSLNGFYGANYYDNNFDIFKQTNWYGNSFVNVSIQIPITSGIDRVKDIGSLKLQSHADESDHRAKQNEVALQRSNAREDLTYREKDLSTKQKSMALAGNSLQIATEQFENGRLLADDLSKSNYQYQQAKTDYLQAMYDYIVAGMQLEKVVRE